MFEESDGITFRHEVERDRKKKIRKKLLKREKINL